MEKLRTSQFKSVVDGPPISLSSQNFLFSSSVILFGSGGRAVEFKENMVVIAMLFYPLFLLAYTFLSFMFCLLAAQLISSSIGEGMQLSKLSLQRKKTKVSEYTKESHLDDETVEKQESVARMIPKILETSMVSMKNQSDSSLMGFNLRQPERTEEAVQLSNSALQTKKTKKAEYREESHLNDETVEKQESVARMIPKILETSVISRKNQSDNSLLDSNLRQPERIELDHPPKEISSLQAIQSVSDEICTGGLVDASCLSNPGLMKESTIVGTGLLDEESHMIGSSEPLDSGSLNSMSAASEGSGRNATTALGRAIKKQVADILEEFWALFFDYHGALTEEAKLIRVHLLLDLALDSSSELKMPAGVAESLSQKFPLAAEKLPLAANPTDYYSGPILSLTAPSTELPYLVDVGSQYWLPTYHSQYHTPSENQVIYTLVPSGFGPLYSGLHYMIPPFSSGTNSLYDNTMHYNTLSVQRYEQYGDSSADVNLQHLNLAFRTEVDRSVSEPILGRKDLRTKLQEQTPPQSSITLTWGGRGISSENGIPKEFLSFRETDRLLIQSVRFCIRKLMKLEGSGWLFFGQNDGCDEELIHYFAVAEKLLGKDDLLQENPRSEEGGKTISLPVIPYCGEGCILQARLVLSFGVWCVHRILDLLLVESRPEVWGKYTYVLNRLQGILDPAFCKPRQPIFCCKCLQLPEALQHTKESPGTVQFTSRDFILELIKDVEISISGRKGQAGTGAAKVAFPQGKKNLAPVLKRYKRRLSKSSS
ncbi:uncharacterized protein A4U43_C04F640 [Asparagus officinalis]|uniref:Uncharacterized protein n=1 Tax=Asparagus officinalis TaxID=4686 RepID=A0A5P1EXQ7_ASPOF|nr:uncharacterized protein LOC109836316 isoform X2 [Asparagus officinalis]ONK70702.1 uncharacterized protein A4U43_C04F640 [Asparagus officinalis]